MQLTSFFLLKKTAQTRFGRKPNKRRLKKLFGADFSSADELLSFLDLNLSDSTHSYTPTQIESAIFDKTEAIIDFVKKNFQNNFVSSFITSEFLFDQTKQSLKSGGSAGLNERVESALNSAKERECFEPIIKALQTLSAYEKDIFLSDIDTVFTKAYFHDKLSSAQKSGYKKLLDLAIAEIDIKNILITHRYIQLKASKEQLLEEYIHSGTIEWGKLYNVFKNEATKENKIAKKYHTLIQILKDKKDYAYYYLEKQKILQKIIGSKNVFNYIKTLPLTSYILTKLCEVKTATMLFKLLSFGQNEQCLQTKTYQEGLNHSLRTAIISNSDNALAYKLTGADVFKEEPNKDAEKILKDLIESSTYSVIFVDESLNLDTKKYNSTKPSNTILTAVSI